jgi:hypothetical protein
MGEVEQPIELEKARGECSRFLPQRGKPILARCYGLFRRIVVAEGCLRGGGGRAHEFKRLGL